MADSPDNNGFSSSATPPPPASPAFQPVAPAFQPIAGSGGAVPAPPQGGGSSALKIILIIVGILVLLVIMAVGVIGFIGYRVAHSIKMGKDGSFSVNTPGGVISNDNTGVAFTADDLGTAPYPGATAEKSGNMRMSLPTGSTLMATYTTPDPKEKVIAFYKDKLGSGATSMEFGEVAILSAKRGDKEVVSVTVAPRGDKTKISISHTTSK